MARPTIIRPSNAKPAAPTSKDPTYMSSFNQKRRRNSNPRKTQLRNNSAPRSLRWPSLRRRRMKHSSWRTLNCELRELWKPRRPLKNYAMRTSSSLRPIQGSRARRSYSWTRSITSKRVRPHWRPKKTTPVEGGWSHIYSLFLQRQ